MTRIGEISEGGGLDGGRTGEPESQNGASEEAAQGGECELEAPAPCTRFRASGERGCYRLGGSRECLEGETEVARGLEAVLRVLLQAVAGDALQAGRNRAADGAEVGRFVLENGVHQLYGGFAGERVLAGEHLVEDDAEGEDVGALVGGLAAELLGGEDDELGEAEIQDLDVPVAGKEDVRRLEVAMDHPLVVGGAEPASDLDGVVYGLAGRQRAGVEALAQRFALEQLDDDIRRALMGSEVVDRDEIRMAQHPRRPGFLLEAAQAVRVLGESGREHLDGNVAAQPGIARAVNLPHAARADQRDDLVRPQLFAG